MIIAIVLLPLALVLVGMSQLAAKLG